MIEILGVKLSYEALAFLAAFVASEVIGMSKLRENSVAQMVKGLIDSFRPSRAEDEKVTALKESLDEIRQQLRELGE